MFSEKELEYIKSQKLLRLATVSPDGQPDLVPLTLSFDGTYFYCGGASMHTTRKYKNVLAAGGTAKVSIEMDDTEVTWPRGIKIYGKGELVERDAGPRREKIFIKITPEVSWSWGVEKPMTPGATGFVKTKH